MAQDQPAEQKVPGELPGGELPSAVYRSVAIAFIWGALAAWLAFGRARGVDFDLSIGLIIFIMAAALPWIIRKTASHHISAEKTEVRPFLNSDVDTATGPLSGRQIWIQILIIPAALALAATLLGMVYVFDR
jgi:hypothetical protein